LYTGILAIFGYRAAAGTVSTYLYKLVNNVDSYWLDILLDILDILHS
jgi:hypothetical protein